MKSIKRFIGKTFHRLQSWADIERPNFYGKDPREAKWPQATFGGKNSINNDVKLHGDIKIGYGSSLGPGCILRGSITIGNYSQLGPRVSLFARAHPLEHATIYDNRALFDGHMKKFQRHDPIDIGHDVLLGCGVIVLRGIKVGNGAVVGAGSVVTHNVPDYAIVAGNPARIIRKRFDAEIVALLSDLEWWNMTVEELISYRDLFEINIAKERQSAINLLSKFKKLKKE